MFTRLTLRGGTASILWGYHCAVALTSWAITKQNGRWKLEGVPARVEPFMARQSPLLFTAPREKGQTWAWGIESLVIGPRTVVAQLGPPEQ
jgi:hypothetical protein